MLEFTKEDLIEEIVKLMYCLKKISNQKEAKVKELKEFKANERQRYENFLAQLKAKHH